MVQVLQDEGFTTSGSDVIELPSGRRLCPYGGIVGIDADLSITEGYDSSLYEAGYDIWSKEDVLALAEIMLIRWEAFKRYAESLDD